MSRAEACKVLQVSPSADAEIITQAYWYLARKYWADAQRDRKARRQLDELNRAYVALNPAAEAPAMTEGPPATAGEPPTMPNEPPVTASEPLLAEEVFAWLRTVLRRTAARWQGRVPEITALSAAVAVLTFLALSAGASALVTVATAVVALLAVLAPWRRA